MINKGIIYLLLTFAFASPFILKAQEDDKKIDNLMFLFVDEKYGKVVDKAGFMMDSDKYKKNPLVYAYMAMGYYEVAKRPEEYDLLEDYKKPIKSSLKYAYKFWKKDKKKEFVGDYTDFFDALKDTAAQVGQHYFLIEKGRKAAGFYKAILKYENDPVIRLWQGLSDLQAKNVPDGEKNLKLALDTINADFVPSKVTARWLASGLVRAEEYWAQKGNSEEAEKCKGLIDVFLKYDPDVRDKEKMAERKRKAKEKDKVVRQFSSDDEDDE